VDELCQHFGLSDLIGEAANMLDNLRMKPGNKISTYNVDQIQDPISIRKQGKSISFQDMYTLAMTIDHCYWKRDRKRHCAR